MGSAQRITLQVSMGLPMLLSLRKGGLAGVIRDGTRPLSARTISLMKARRCMTMP